MQRKPTIFQSTLPRGERPRLPIEAFLIFLISIHAPAGGATAKTHKCIPATLPLYTKSYEQTIGICPKISFYSILLVVLSDFSSANLPEKLRPLSVRTFLDNHWFFWKIGTFTAKMFDFLFILVSLPWKLYVFFQLMRIHCAIGCSTSLVYQIKDLLSMSTLSSFLLAFLYIVSNDFSSLLLCFPANEGAIPLLSTIILQLFPVVFRLQNRHHPCKFKGFRAPFTFYWIY